MAEDVFGIVGSLQASVFRVERVVAEGGFGVVYRAHHEGFKAAVALKCLKIPGAFSAEQRQAFLQKFQEEGEVLFRLSALIPSVVRPLHVGTFETSRHPFVPFIALEWLDGESLDSVVDRRRAAGKPPLDLARVVRMMGPVARALECAHKFPGPGGTQLSILHRDLKPENLFLAKVHGQETLKILDFGIGKVRSAATQMVGRVSAEQGASIAAFTPAYGAPEQWLPKRYGQSGPWTDVWGFALCAVEALTNKAPFEGDAPAVMGACIDEQERPTPLTLGVKVPDRAEAAFRKALAVDPVNRFHDIGAFWDEIEAASGVTTPRISTTQSVEPDSLPPPPGGAGQPSSLLTEIDATKQVPGAQLYPDLTLGLPKQKAPQLAKAAKAAAPSASGGGGRLLESSAHDAMHISLMQDVEEQLKSAPGPRSSPKAALPQLAVSPRVARTRNVRSMPSEAPTMDTVLARMMPALRLIGVGVAIMIADVVYATVNGEAFRVGPMRALWIAGPLVGYGVVKLVLSLVG
jgi:serine/threonine-protein kinase